MRHRRQTSRFLKINLMALALLHATVFVSVCLARQEASGRLPPPAQSPGTNAPLVTKEWLLNALRTKELKAEEIVRRVEERGVAFRMTLSDESELSAAGATPALVEAVRKNYRRPFDRKELLGMLRLTRQRPPRATASDVLGEIKKRGVSFQLTTKNKAALRRAGASAEIISAARQNYRPVMPSLPVAATLDVDPILLPSPRSTTYGDPKSPTQPSSGQGSGTGTGTGSGSGTGGGVCPGRGDNTGGGDSSTGGARGKGPVDYTRPFKQNEVTKKALILAKPEPGYTEEARRNSVSGVVSLCVVLHSSGAVTNIKVVKGLPDGLTERAIAAARQIRFTPAQKDGRTVSQYVVVEYNFKIY